MKDPSSNPLWKHQSGSWAKKKNGKTYYFGKDKTEAEERYNLWLVTGIHYKTCLSQFLNAWLNKSYADGSVSFDEWYAGYWYGTQLIGKHGLYAKAAAIQKFIENRSEMFSTWDLSRRVYVVRGGDAVKIGSADSVGRRIKALQTGCPHDLELLLDLPGGDSHESELHARFRKQRLRRNGEWFSFDDHVAHWVSLVADASREIRNSRTGSREATSRCSSAARTSGGVL